MTLQTFANNAWDTTVDGVVWIKDNAGNLAKLAGAAAVIGGVIWVGSKAVNLGSNFAGGVSNAYREAKHSIDDKFITGINPKGHYAPISDEFDYNDGKLSINFENGRTEIKFETSNGGKYRIQDTDGNWDKPEKVEYRAPDEGWFTPKAHLGESHEIVLREAEVLYRASTAYLEDRLKVK